MLYIRYKSNMWINLNLMKVYSFLLLTLSTRVCMEHFSGTQKRKERCRIICDCLQLSSHLLATHNSSPSVIIITQYISFSHTLLIISRCRWNTSARLKQNLRGRLFSAIVNTTWTMNTSSIRALFGPLRQFANFICGKGTSCDGSQICTHEQRQVRLRSFYMFCSVCLSCAYYIMLCYIINS